MRIFERLRRTRRTAGWLCVLSLVVGLSSTLARAQARTTAPTSAPAPAPTPAPDPTGATGGPTAPLLNPNPYLTGWVSGTADKNLDAPSGGTFKPWAGDKPTVEELGQHTAKLYYSMNFVWVLVAGFLVIFMQAGFALVETGLCRAKNAAHTMSMNFMVYALGMFGFFVCGYAFMCGGASASNIGGPGSLGGIAVLDKMVTVGDGWGIIGKTGFFLTGKAYDAQAIVWFLFMMVFMDTTATIPTGALAERWSFKSFF